MAKYCKGVKEETSRWNENRVVLIPDAVQRRIAIDQTMQKIIGIPKVPYMDKVVDVSIVQVVSDPTCAGVQETAIVRALLATRLTRLAWRAWKHVCVSATASLKVDRVVSSDDLGLFVPASGQLQFGCAANIRAS